MAFEFFKKIFKLHKIYGPNAYFVALCFGISDKGQADHKL